MDKVREYQKEGYDLEEAIKETVKYCEKHDILKEYLKIHGSEVLNMLLEEWNMEDAIEKAINYCIEHNILKEFLEENTSEVSDMLMAEYVRNIMLELLSQGLTPEEIKQRFSS